MSRSGLIERVLVGLLAFGLVGCASSQVAKHWGEAYHQNNTNMIANPNAAEENIEPPTGLDASTGEKVIEAYKGSQCAPKTDSSKPSIINISR